MNSKRDRLCDLVKSRYDELHHFQEARDNANNCMLEIGQAFTGIISRVDSAAMSASQSQLESLSQELLIVSNLISTFERTLRSVSRTITSVSIRSIDRSINQAIASVAPSKNATGTSSISSVDRGRSPASPEKRPSLASPILSSSFAIHVPLPRGRGRRLESPMNGYWSSGVGRGIRTSPAMLDRSSPSEAGTSRSSSVPPRTVLKEVLGNGSGADCPMLETSSTTHCDDAISPVQTISDHSPDNGSDITSSSIFSTASSCSSPAAQSSSSTSDGLDSAAVPRGQLPLEDFFRFHMRQIVSPDEFYIEPYVQEGQSSNTAFRHELNRYYSDPANQIPLFQQGGDNDRPVRIHGIFCRVSCTNGEENLEAERCEVLAWNDAVDPLEVEILYIDLGRKEWVIANEVWKFHKRFCDVPALTVRCRLFDVLPVFEGDPLKAGGWSEEAIAKFRSLVDDRQTLRGRVMNRAEPFKLIMYYSENQQDCVNKEFVSTKLARSLTNWDKVGALLVRRYQRRS